MAQAFIKQLPGLVRANVDAFHANAQALKNVDVPRMQRLLQRAQGDHERHAQELVAALERHGAVPPALAQDLWGWFIEGYAALLSATGLDGALRALLRNERMLNRTYDDALAVGLPAAVQTLLLGNREDERRHLREIHDMLDTRVREAPPALASLLELPPPWLRLPT